MVPKSVQITTAVSGLALAVYYIAGATTRQRKSLLKTDFATFANPLNKESASPVQDYDVIIIGGGTAGCVLASRLSEDPTIRVLLLEAGESSADIAASQMPAGWASLFKTAHDWAFYTTPQIHAGNRKLFWPRGKMLGGSSSINAMMYHHGSPQDFDQWADLQKEQGGASEWSFKHLSTYFRKFEKYIPHVNFPEVDVTHRGDLGNVKVGHFGYFAQGTNTFIKACVNAGIPYSNDVNTQTGTLGVTKVPTYIDEKGRRVTAETAYLTLDVLARTNLTVATGAHVERIVFDKTGSSPRAVGVQFADKQGRHFVAKSRKEVIVSAGAVSTPQILQLSGVGPASHLSSFGIPVVADLPGVGSNLKDHLVISLHFQDKHKSSLSYLKPSGLVQNLRVLAALAQYRLTGQGPLSCNIGEAMAFCHSADPKLFPPDKFASSATPEDVATGPGAPDIEILYTPLAFKEQGFVLPPNFGKYNFGIHAVLLQPQSSGTVRLKSTNPLDPPVIDTQYLADPNDVKTLLRSVRFVDQLIHTEPLASAVDPEGHDNLELHHNLSAASDSELETMIRNSVETLYHPCCTARMAPLEDGGVVDTALRVHGIPNLRVVDASVFPNITSGHTTAPVYAVAEKAADLIKAAVCIPH